ncbi:hypothetical protein ANO14919_028290 [Xylariales sp. No.14919]|nr:hypothetical protein ANO14919_028290 [Xylariales sp. No.14919]
MCARILPSPIDAWRKESEVLAAGVARVKAVFFASEIMDDLAEGSARRSSRVICRQDDGEPRPWTPIKRLNESYREIAE